MNMKNLTPAFLLILAASACSNPLDYTVGQQPEMIIMNAQLRTDETRHLVSLSRGLINSAEPLPDAELDCYINGRPVGRARPCPADSNYVSGYRGERFSSEYLFDAEIRPGDEVRLVASCGQLHAQVTVQAPLPALLASADTVSIPVSPYSVMYTSYGEEYTEALACRLRLQDRPGEQNWYRLCVDLVTDRERHSVRFGFDRDLILNDGYKSSDAFDIGQAPDNEFCSFSDKQFTDRSAEVEIHVLKNNIRFVRKYWTESDHPALRLRFLTISLEEYAYLGAINAAEIWGFDGAFLTEPVSFPSNVEGGLGLVSVASASDILLELQDLE